MLGVDSCEMWDNAHSQWTDQGLHDPIVFSEDGTTMIILRLNHVGHCQDLGSMIQELETRESDDDLPEDATPAGSSIDKGKGVDRGF